MIATNAQEAKKLITEKLSAAGELIRECESLADEFLIGFSFDIAGYGMGGYYQGHAEDATNEYGEEIDGWNSSSQNC
jgi:hypothetical protein